MKHMATRTTDSDSSGKNWWCPSLFCVFGSVFDYQLVLNTGILKSSLRLEGCLIFQVEKFVKIPPFESGFPVGSDFFFPGFKGPFQKGPR